MAQISQLFNLALWHQQNGNAAQAESLYRQVIQADFAHADAHNNLGMILYGQGQLAEAAACFRLALRFNPNHVDAYSNLGVTLIDLGQLEDAILCLRQALRINPNIANAHNTLGVALKENGQLAEAIMSFRQALAINANLVDAYCNMGAALHDLGQLAEAIQCLRQAMQIHPAHSEVHNNLGAVLKDNGQVSEAIMCFRQAIAINPQNASAHNNLGLALDSQGMYAEAVECYQKALTLNPNHANAHNNLGLALDNQGKNAEAIECYRKALALNPSYALAHNNLGNTLRIQGNLDEAAASYLEAIRLKPDYDDAHFNLGMLWLLVGNFEKGWLGYEWRFQLKKGAVRSFSQPRWNGEPLEGKTILLQAEQGLGDTLQFIRFAPLVKQQGGKVLLKCPAELAKIIQRCPGIDQILTPDKPLPPFDYHIALLSLPAIMKTTLATVPDSIPYLRADPVLTQHWQQELNNYSEFKIGIIWQRNPRFSEPECRAGDKKRSIPLAQFEPLARLPGVRLFSLQKGFGTEQLADWKTQLGVIDLGDKLDDFMDTAAVMMNMDLVISADTSPAHLAGALGRPVWTALPFSGCWRWLLNREDSPWYPTMRLFRQPKPGDWETVFKNMAEALNQLIYERRPL